MKLAAIAIGVLIAYIAARRADAWKEARALIRRVNTPEKATMNKLKLSTLLPLVGAGLALVNPKVWMNKPRATALVAALLATLLQVLKLYDIDLPLDHETLLALAGLVVTGVLYGRGQRDAVQAKSAPAELHPAGPDQRDGDEPASAPVHPADREAP